MTLTHGSLFSGVGGFDLGADAAGIETLWQCEIDAKPRSVLARHWPNATRYTDVKDVKGDEITPVDIISFGSPCQDLSVAGKRAGLKGSRSGLFHQAIRVAKEMQDATQGQYPRFLIWENVRGALSSNEGKDFKAAVEAMAQLGAVDISWRLVNACHFGVPQRRVRVFVVADLRGDCAGEVLTQPTRLLWHPPQSTEPGQETTGEVEDSTGSSGYDEYNDKLTGTIHHTLRAGTKQSTGALVDYKVRRLTPRECERLMGWPDDHTRWDKDGKELSDSARYKMCGNGIAAPVAQWVCENLVRAVQSEQPEA